MNETENMLRTLAKKTMFNIADDEMEAMVEEYNVFMSHVKAIDEIDTTGVEPLAFPYVIETSFLRDDDTSHVVSREDALKNAKVVQENQIKVPKVVG